MKNYEREKSKYLGHDIRLAGDENTLLNSVIIGYESSKWQSKNTFAFFVLH